MATFKPRKITNDQVDRAINSSQDVPLAGDPRAEAITQPSVPALDIGTMEKDESKAKVGAIQVLVESAANYLIGQTYDIPVQRIKSNPYNARVIYTSASVDEMAISLAKDGQTTPATAYISKDGQVTLVDGETRLRGSRSGGMPTLRVEIQEEPKNNRALYEKARTANVHRNDQTPLDDAIKWTALIESKEYKNQVEIANALGYREDHVSRIMKLAIFTMPVMYSLAEEPSLLNLRMLTAIREYFEAKGGEATLELIPDIAKNDTGYRKVTELAKADSTGATRARSERSAVSYGTAKGEVKSFAKGGRLELSIKGLSEDEMTELREKIVALLQKKQ